MARKKTTDTKKDKQLVTQAAALADYAAKALVAAEQLRIKTKVVEAFPLTDDERAIAAERPATSRKIKNVSGRPK
jgi:hypothetical protein